MSVNLQILVGNVTRDPEVKHLDGGVSVANFGLATNESYKNKAGEKVDSAEFHNIIAWRGLADLAEKWIVKGQQIYVEGKTTHRKYTDKNDVEKSITEVVATNIRLLGSKSGSSNQPQTGSPGIPEDDGSGLPF